VGSDFAAATRDVVVGWIRLGAERVEVAMARLGAERAEVAMAPSRKDASAVPLPPLRHEADLSKLHRRRADLLRIEKDKKGHYTMDELKAIGDRPALEEAIEELESRSRGWLEDDDVFRQRVQACVAKANAARKGSSGGGGGQRPASSGGGGGSGGFTRVGGSGAKKPQAKASGPSTRNAFAALG